MPLKPCPGSPLVPPNCLIRSKDSQHVALGMLMFRSSIFNLLAIVIALLRALILLVATILLRSLSNNNAGKTVKPLTFTLPKALISLIESSRLLLSIPPT